MTSVTISQGTLRGREAETVSGFKYCEFLEIPYAKPPIGNLRFKNPESPEPWEGERDATTYHVERIACQINSWTGNKFAGSENCLYLNVYTPQIKPNSDSLPVLVYIHGGGFIHGSGTNNFETGPDYFIENNLVVVIINYRLGIFGFLSLDIPEAAGNMGLKDQVKALEWVRKNISHFGGDKNNVTILGVSAGSVSCEYLLLSPLAKGLFHKAILHSGSALNSWAINFEYKKLLVRTLIELRYGGSILNNRAVLEFLLKVPPKVLLEAASVVTEKFTSKRIFLGFVPTIEKNFGTGNSFLTELPYKLIKAGKIINVPVIRGFCNLEGAVMNFLQPSAIQGFLVNKNFATYWPYELDASDIENYNCKLKTEYIDTLTANDESDTLAIRFFGDLHFSAGVAISGKLSSSKNTPNYMYQFLYNGNRNFVKIFTGIKGKGAVHGDDLGYLFRNKALDSIPSNETDILVRSRIIRMWTNFAKTNNPTPSKTEEIPVEWPPYTIKNPAYLIIDDNLTIASNYEPKRMAIFEEAYEKYKK